MTCTAIAIAINWVICVVRINILNCFHIFIGSILAITTVTELGTFQVSFFAKTTVIDITVLAPTVYKVKYGVGCWRQSHPCNVHVSQVIDFPSMSRKSRCIHHGVRGTSPNKTLEIRSLHMLLQRILIWW